ncbi:hypothetical protein ACLOJK_000778 [Asimina triloba]
MAEEKQHHHHRLFHHDKEEEKVSATEVNSDGYGGVAAETTGSVKSNLDYEKEVKQHKHKEHLGELAVRGAGAFALVNHHFSQDS